MADERIRVFLSSPMNNSAWRNLRESVITLFEHSALKDLFDLRYIENQSGDTPAEIYDPIAKDCHATVTLFKDEIRPDVKKELSSAKNAGRPIIAFQEKGGKLSEEDKNFVRDHLYPATTVCNYSSMDDLFKKIKSGLIGLLARRLELRNDEEKLTKVMGELMAKSLPENKALLMFAAFANNTSQHQTALPLFTHAVASRPNDDELFIAMMALAVTADSRIPAPLGDHDAMMAWLVTEDSLTLPPKGDLDRLAALADKNDNAALVLSSLKYRHGDASHPQTVKVAGWLKKKSSAWATIAKLDQLIQRMDDAVEFSVNEIVEIHRQVKKIKKSLDSIRVDEIDIFSWVEAELNKRLPATPVKLDDADIPDVEACWICMLRENMKNNGGVVPLSGEDVVPLSAELGGLEDLLKVHLYGKYPGPEWYDFHFGGLTRTCKGCGNVHHGNETIFAPLHPQDTFKGTE